MTNPSYLLTKQRREAYEEQKGEIVFGLLGGFILLMLGIMNNWLIFGSFNLFAILSLILIIIGLLLIFAGIVVPSILKLPYKGFMYIGKKIGTAILLFFLTLVYVAIVFPVGIFMRRKRRGLGFFIWNGDFPFQEKAFENIRDGKNKNSGSFIKSPFIKNIYNLFGILIQNKRAFLIPAAVVLVLLGLILFFAASNVVFNFFIYTLF